MIEYFKRLKNISYNDFLNNIKENLKNNKKMFIITANPEIFMLGKRDSLVNEILLSDKTTCVCDGIGLVKAARMLNIGVKERITGIDLSYDLLKEANEKKYKVAIIGSKEEVIEKLKDVLKNDYPNIIIDKIDNGYIENKDDFFKKLDADIVLVGTGMPSQEKLIYKNYDKFNKGIFMGVGGSLDVISKSKKRAPKIFQKLNIEWLYRICLEPKRLKRFYNNNIKFIFEVKKIRKEK